MKHLKVKKLIEGHKISYHAAGKKLIAFKEDYMSDEITIEFHGEFMLIPANTRPYKYGEEKFEDKYGRGFYKLVYYEWQPNQPKQLSIL